MRAEQRSSHGGFTSMSGDQEARTMALQSPNRTLPASISSLSAFTPGGGEVGATRVPAQLSPGHVLESMRRRAQMSADWLQLRRWSLTPPRSRRSSPEGRDDHRVDVAGDHPRYRYELGAVLARPTRSPCSGLSGVAQTAGMSDNGSQPRLPGVAQSSGSGPYRGGTQGQGCRPL